MDNIFDSVRVSIRAVGLEPDVARLLQAVNAEAGAANHTYLSVSRRPDMDASIESVSAAALEVVSRDAAGAAAEKLSSFLNGRMVVLDHEGKTYRVEGLDGFAAARINAAAMDLNGHVRECEVQQRFDRIIAQIRGDKAMPRFVTAASPAPR